MSLVLRTAGRYEILREIGHGGMAVVYLARQTDLDREVALKELRMLQAPDQSFAQRFLREAQVVGSLSHPNIVTVHEYFEDRGTPYIAMEFVRRGSLRPQVGNMTLAQIAGVLEGVLAGLDHAERQQIVHRDLKPENLMVTDEGRIKIADFGIAKARNRLQTGAMLTATGTTVGTPTYMAPEQAMAQELSPATDLYSVGIMVYEMLTGRVPFHDTETPVALLMRHVNEAIPPVRDVVPEIDAELSDWVDALLRKDPRERTQSAAAAWDDFEEIVLRLAGSRWRREARLDQPAASGTAPTPLTPAPFDGTQASGFESFAWTIDQKDASESADAGVAPSQPSSTAGAPSVPAPASTPTGEAEDDVPVHPGEPDDASRFVTFDGGPAQDAQAAAPDEHVAQPRPHDVEGSVGAESPAEPGPRTSPPEELRPAEAGEPALAVADDASVVDEEPLSGGATAAGDATVMPDAVPDDEPSSRARPAPTARSWSTRRFVAVFAGVAGVAGFLIGHSGERRASGGAADAVVANADLQLKVPDSWSVIAPAPATPGFTLRAPVAAGGDGVTVEAGMAGSGASDPRLLPRTISRDVGTDLPSPVTVQLGDSQAYRYDAVRPKGSDRVLTVYVSPTTDGVATIICSASTASPSVRRRCGTVARTLALKAAQPLAVGPSAEYGKQLASVLAKLRGRVGAGSARLADAKTAKGQGAAAATLASAYRAAAAALTTGGHGPAETTANRELLTALRATGNAYAALAVAARRSDRSGYAEAATAVRRGNAGVAEAAAALKAAGYAIGGRS